MTLGGRVLLSDTAPFSTRIMKLQNHCVGDITGGVSSSSPRCSPWGVVGRVICHLTFNWTFSIYLGLMSAFVSWPSPCRAFPSTSAEFAVLFCFSFHVGCFCLFELVIVSASWNRKMKIPPWPLGNDVSLTQLMFVSSRQLPPASSSLLLPSIYIPLSSSFFVSSLLPANPTAAEPGLILPAVYLPSSVHHSPPRHLVFCELLFLSCSGILLLSLSRWIQEGGRGGGHDGLTLIDMADWGDEEEGWLRDDGEGGGQSQTKLGMTEMM